MIDYFGNCHGVRPLSSSWSCLQFVEYQITIISPMIHWVSGRSNERVSNDLLSIKWILRAHLWRLIEYRVDPASASACKAVVEHQILTGSPSVEYRISITPPTIPQLSIKSPTSRWVLDINRVSDSLSIGYQSRLQRFFEYWISIASLSVEYQIDCISDYLRIDRVSKVDASVVVVS